MEKRIAYRNGREDNGSHSPCLPGPRKVTYTMYIYIYIYTYTTSAIKNSIISMDTSLLSLFVFVLVGRVLGSMPTESSFDQYYNISWGDGHFLSLDQGREIQLSMDNSSGAGFGSKLSYGSGFFHLRIKLPEKDSAGVITAFYLTSHTNNHDELDFEFLGNKEGKPITLQTNVFANGQGNREQRIHLWFYVDKIPIRVFKNNTMIGVSYPSQPMQVEASLWDGIVGQLMEAKQRLIGLTAPFKAHFQGFNIDGCPYNLHSKPCDSSIFWWNKEKYWSLSSTEQRVYEAMRNST
ncbi:hypothetical protein HHK36_032792 [Tetracentron sinense]|uniref:GH16 domain-containing protein n=1 Tax=Tetracentron sinense TaxID=13715 RepID=A0A834Y6F5_TETSI|nr:hypothetical protein HHK36_032792 [Tetracentron sinense]